jgi:hypothetical protein
MGTPYSRILRGHRVGLGHLAEEGFHFPSREKRDENPATCLTDKGPDMGNLARCQQRITRLEAKTLCPHLELELAFEDIEPFLLVIMQMACWTTFGQEGVLQRKGSLGVGVLTLKAMLLMPSPRLSPSRSAPAARNTPEDLSADLDSLITLSSR